MSDAFGHIEVKPRERAEGRRKVASKAKFKYEDSDSEDKSESDDELHDNDSIKEKKVTSTAAHSNYSNVDVPWL